MNIRRMNFVPALALAGTVGLVALSNGGCSAASTIVQYSQGCNEFPSMVDSLDLKGDAQAFVQAGADLVNVAANLEDNVLAACVGIDTDLSVMDTWSALTTKDAQLQEACKQATTAIQAALAPGASAQASCALAITGGQCTVDANVEASCEAGCSAMATCTPPDITLACQAGQLSVQCMGTCNASATCEGSVTASAMCQGSCEADCTGMCVPGTAPSVHCEGTCMGNCNGTCTASGGTAMASTGHCAGTCSGSCDAACMIDPGKPAHCDGSCHGSCNGNCKLDANVNINCGANVSCKGGCTGNFTAPKCEGEITPPSCNASANCQASCKSHADIKAMCTPPSVSLECGASVSANLQKVVMTVEKNFPAIIAAVQTEGPLAVKATENLVNSGGAVAGDLGSLSGKALACATSAASASVSATASINVSVSASVSVSGSAGGPGMAAM